MAFELRTVEALISSVGELTENDLDVLVVMGPGVEGALGGTRIKHHKIAQLAACGMKQVEIAELVGYSNTYVSILLRSPALQGLVTEYIKAGWTEIEAVTRRARMAASAGVTEIHKRIETNPSGFSNKDLTNATLGLLDRGGITQRHAVLHFGLSRDDIAGIVEKAAQHDGSRVVEILAEDIEVGDGGAEIDGSVSELRLIAEGKGS